MKFLNYSLIAAAIIQVLCQFTKLIVYSIKDRAFNLNYLFTAGGMPSSHSAFVTALSVSLGLTKGFNSEYFAIAFVFSAIVIYDAYRLRGTVQLHSRLLEKLKDKIPGEENTKIPQMVGHTMPEIIAGIITGTLFAVGVYFIAYQWFK